MNFLSKIYKAASKSNYKGSPLDARTLNEVDEEIRYIIQSINILPFVNRTLWSCAGYGKAGSAPRHPGEIPKGDPLGHKPGVGGMFMVSYNKNMNYKQFHKQISDISSNFKILGTVSRKHNHLTKDEIGYTYYFSSPIVQWKKVQRILEK